MAIVQFISFDKSAWGDWRLSMISILKIDSNRMDYYDPVQCLPNANWANVNLIL